MVLRGSTYGSERDVEVKLLDPLFRDELGYAQRDLAWAVPVTLTFGREKKTKEADLVVKHKKTPVIAVEAKKPTEPVQGGMGQIDSYAFALETPYSLITNGRHLVVRGYYASNRRINIIDGTIDELSRARWAPLRDLLGFEAIRKSMQEQPNIVPSPSEEKITNFRRFFRRIHNTIRDSDKLDPAAAFDELSKLLFLKAAEDEGARRNDVERLPVLTAEMVAEWERLGKTKARKLVQEWFSEATERLFPGVFSDHPEINLSTEALKSILAMMKPFHVRSGDVDVKGRAFEEFLPSQLRGKGLGQFFTPRPIVNFMADMADVSMQDVVVDFACGSGGFLIKAFEQMKRGVEELPSGTLKRIGTSRDAVIEDIISKQLSGIDAEPRAARTAKMNMLMWGDGRRVVRGNALDVVDFNGKPYEPAPYSERDPNSGCTLILANPPFGSKETKQEILARYALGSKFTEREVERTEVLFVERGLSLLRPEGRMLIVLPQGIISNQSDQGVRDYIHSQAEVRAIISLPTHAFTQSGVPTVNTCILYLQKFTEKKKRLYDECTADLPPAATRELLRRDPEFNYPIFMGTAEFVGYEPSGRMIVDAGESTDLDLLLEDFRNQAVTSSPELDMFDFAARHYGESPLRKKDQTIRGTKKGLKTSFVVCLKDTIDRLDPPYYLFQQQANALIAPLSPLGRSVQEKPKKFAPVTEDELDTEYSVLSVSSDGTVTLGEHVRGESIAQKFKRVATGDIVYNPMRINIGSVGVVPAEHDGGLVSPDYVVFRSNRLAPEFLVALLRSPFYRMYIDVITTGSIRDRLYFKDLQTIRVPGVSEGTQREVMEQVERIESFVATALKGITEQKTVAVDRINGLVFKPEIAVGDEEEESDPEGSKMRQSKEPRRKITKEDRRDAEIARERIREIKENPRTLISGKELQDRLDKLNSRKR